MVQLACRTGGCAQKPLSGVILHRWQIAVTGTVQGVGFRPFVHRIASCYNLTGWVRNTPAGVILEVQGEEVALDCFVRDLAEKAPPLARITGLKRTSAGLLENEAGFAILPSSDGTPLVQVAPDGDLCADCLKELFDPADRRYRHPFITCTNCGPRFSIITGIPYDRPLTTMNEFPLCPDCLKEYKDPSDRRFHAQPVSCHQCGPQLRLVDGDAVPIAGDQLRNTLQLLKEGKIVAIKGIGGFHLAVDAENDAAVGELRIRKKRDEKPFAVMVKDVQSAGKLVAIDALAEKLLTGTERPVVIVRKVGGRVQGAGYRVQGTGDSVQLEGYTLSPLVAPGNGWLGVMLPSTPVQHLLFAEGLCALVMTSGNRADEPIAADNEEAVENLKGIADAFLLHDRKIANRSDDSVMRVFRGNPLFYRRARGYVPRPVPLPTDQPSILAVGAELKGTICLTRGLEAFPGQHLGDLQQESSLAFLSESAEQLKQLLQTLPVAVAHDLHPDFLSTRYAEQTGLPLIGVQHHHAHFAACLGENRFTDDAIGIIFDGTGIGTDGSVWGGEFLLGSGRSFQRVGHLLKVMLPGGDAAVREPRRMGLSWLYRAYGESFADLSVPSLIGISPDELSLLRQMLVRGINSPWTSSVGRLFDAVASILGVRQRISYEGQAAIELEALAESAVDTSLFPYAVVKGMDGWELDMRPVISALVDELSEGADAATLACRFHSTLAEGACAVCKGIRENTGISAVALSGGVFQNKLLTEELSSALERNGFTVLLHRLLPPNDGCISYGQAVVAGYRLQN